MLFRSKLEKYIAIRVILLMFLIEAADIVFIDKKWISLAGLVTGGIYGILRLGATSAAFTALIGHDRSFNVSRSVLKYILVQAATIVLLIASIAYDVWLFTGVLAGILLVPAVMLIAGILRGLGLARFDFE